MALLSKRCVYGLRATLYLVAHQEGRGYVSIKDIAEALEVSFHFLTKILQQLTEGGFLLSSRGSTGGVMMARPAGEISVLDVIECLDGPDLFQACVLGMEGCNERKPCPLHASWVSHRAELYKLFSHTTLDALGRETLELSLRLAG